MNAPVRLRGSLRALLLFDIAEQIELGALSGILGTKRADRQPAFRQPAPEYVRFERPPAVEEVDACSTSSGEVFQARIRYFDYGVASVDLQLRFQADWRGLIQLANRWMLSSELEGLASVVLRERLKQTGRALKKPYEGWTTENYYIIQLDPAVTDNGETVMAEELVRQYGSEIAQIVRSEEFPLSNSERQEVLQSSMSYYPGDLLVVGWIAALVYDTPAGAAPTIELLEYANTQLLEFRYYDDVLTRVLDNVYKQLDERRSFWARWRLAREAENLNTIRLDYLELSEHTENAIKFLSDMFYARVYRLAAARIGVTDYLALVREKLALAGELYESMIDEFHQARAFFLEAMVVIILVIEIVFLFRGKG
jgi:hypothetical protein